MTINELKENIITRTNKEFDKFRNRELNKPSNKLFRDARMIYMRENIIRMFLEEIQKMGEDDRETLEAVINYEGKIIATMYCELQHRNEVDFEDIEKQVEIFLDYDIYGEIYEGW